MRCAHSFPFVPLLLRLLVVHCFLAIKIVCAHLLLLSFTNILRCVPFCLRRLNTHTTASLHQTNLQSKLENKKSNSSFQYDTYKLHGALCFFLVRAENRQKTGRKKWKFIFTLIFYVFKSLRRCVNSVKSLSPPFRLEKHF